MVMMLCNECGMPYSSPASIHTCKPLTYITNTDNRLSSKYSCVNKFEHANVFVVYGGDGTVLNCINKIPKNLLHNIVILGVNTGHVGFLSNDINKYQVENLFDLDRPRFNTYISKRMLLQVTNGLAEQRVMNDIVVQPTHRGRLFDLIIEVNEQKLIYRGDGVIISTPSGSTAHNLSAGGPIISPDLETITITPICPFSLSTRPIVVNSGSNIKITSIKSAEVIVDGVIVLNSKLDSMEVVAAKETVNLFKVDSFYDAIQKKLNWNKSIK